MYLFIVKQDINIPYLMEFVSSSTPVKLLLSFEISEFFESPNVRIVEAGMNSEACKSSNGYPSKEIPINHIFNRLSILESESFV